MVDTGSKFQIYTAVYITETMEQWFLLKTIMVHDWLGRSVLLPIGERLQNAYWPPNLNQIRLDYNCIINQKRYMNTTNVSSLLELRKQLLVIFSTSHVGVTFSDSYITYFNIFSKKNCCLETFENLLQANKQMYEFYA